MNLRDLGTLAALLDLTRYGRTLEKSFEARPLHYRCMAEDVS